MQPIISRLCKKQSLLRNFRSNICEDNLIELPKTKNEIARK